MNSRNALASARRKVEDVVRNFPKRVSWIEDRVLRSGRIIRADLRSPGSKIRSAWLPATVLASWIVVNLTQHGWLTRHDDVTNWSVAVATGSLAFFTYLLARQAHDQVHVAQNQLIAAQRPMVLPVVDEDLDWTDLHVSLKNVGVGPAYNVAGRIFWRDPTGGATLTPCALGSDDTATVVLDADAAINWSTVSGYLRYRDLSDIEWQTHFVYRQAADDAFFIEVRAVDRTSALGEPNYSSNGWVNAIPFTPLPIDVN